MKRKITSEIRNKNLPIKSKGNNSIRDRTCGMG
jgi:hypothetical protein